MDIECTRYIHRVTQHPRRNRKIRKRTTIHGVHGKKIRRNSRVKRLLLLYTFQEINFKNFRSRQAERKESTCILERKMSSSTPGSHSFTPVSNRKITPDIYIRRYLHRDRQLHAGIQIKNNILGAQVDTRRLSEKIRRNGKIPIHDRERLHR